MNSLFPRAAKILQEVPRGNGKALRDLGDVEFLEEVQLTNGGHDRYSECLVAEERCDDEARDEEVE